MTPSPYLDVSEKEKKKREEGCQQEKVL